MANISHFTQTVNGVSTTYDIHDANAIPRSGGAVMTGSTLSRATSDQYLNIDGGQGWGYGATVSLRGKDVQSNAGACIIQVADSNTYKTMFIVPDGTGTVQLAK